MQGTCVAFAPAFPFAFGNRFHFCFRRTVPLSFSVLYFWMPRGGALDISINQNISSIFYRDGHMVQFIPVRESQASGRFYRRRLG